jgi:flagellar motor switch protein FliN
MDPHTTEPQPPALDQLAPAAPSAAPQRAATRPALLKIPVTVQVVLGQARMSLGEVMALAPGAVIKLDAEVARPVSLLANGNEVAKGLIVVADEATGQLAISITAIGGSSTP